MWRRACASIALAGLGAAAPVSAAAPSERSVTESPNALNATAAFGLTAAFHPLAPVRVLDTRAGLGAPNARPAAGATVDVQLGGVAGVTAAASAVVLNVTATDAPAPGFVQVFPTGLGEPGATSNLNVERAGQTVANLVVVKLGAGGRVSVYTQSGAHLVADVLGFFEPATTAAAGRYVALTAPTRVLDTRDPDLVPVASPGDSVDCTDFTTWQAANMWFWTYHRYGDVAHLDRNGDDVPCESLPGSPASARVPPDLFRLDNAGAFRLPVAVGATLPGGVVPAEASAVVLNLTATGTTSSGFLQVYPTGGATSAGSSSNLNVSAIGQTISNLVVVPIGSDGTVTIYTQSATHVVADIAGYFTGADAAVSSDGLFIALDPARVLDTRLGLGAPVAKASAGQAIDVSVTGHSDVPATGVSSVFMNATMTDASAPGFVQVYPTGQATAGSTSNLNIEHVGQTRPAAVFARLGNRGQVTLYTQSGGDLIADVAGYFSGPADATNASASEHLVFADDFNGSSLATDTWSTCYWWATQGCTIATNNELEWYLPSQVSVHGGVLHLRADASPVRAADGREFAFQSGMISGLGASVSGFSFTYGRVEARVRVPSGPGLWPGVWLLPVTRSNLPEIDIMEVNGANPRSLSTHLHYRDASGAHDVGGATAGDDLSGGWHVVAIDWSPGQLVWFVDGREVRRVEGAIVPDEPMYVIANLAVGGEFVGDPTAATYFPSELLVDSIRVWSA